MLSSASNNLAAQIQSVLSSGDFDGAGPLITTFADAARAQVDAARTSSDRQLLLAESLDHLHGWLHLSRVLRSHLSSRLHAAIGQSRYSSASPRPPVIQLEA
jgi:hypothetical protein